MGINKIKGHDFNIMDYQLSVQQPVMTIQLNATIKRCAYY